MNEKCIWIACEYCSGDSGMLLEGCWKSYLHEPTFQLPIQISLLGFACFSFSSLSWSEQLIYIPLHFRDGDMIFVFVLLRMTWRGCLELMFSLHIGALREHSLDLDPLGASLSLLTWTLYYYQRVACLRNSPKDCWRTFPQSTFICVCVCPFRTFHHFTIYGGISIMKQDFLRAKQELFLVWRGDSVCIFPRVPGWLWLWV